MNNSSAAEHTYKLIIVDTLKKKGIWHYYKTVKKSASVLPHLIRRVGGEARGQRESERKRDLPESPIRIAPLVNLPHAADPFYITVDVKYSNITSCDIYLYAQ